MTSDTYRPRHLLELALAVCLLCLLGPLSYSIGGVVPISLQSLLVVLAPLLTSKWRGSLAVVLYLLAGFAGLPVFAGGSSGFEKLWGPTAGFLLAFPLAAFVTGTLAERGGTVKAIQVAATLFLGQTLILLIGFAWLLIYEREMGGMWDSLMPLLPGLFLKTLLGTALFLLVRRWLPGKIGA